jgi:hypothetical protein
MDYQIESIYVGRTAKINVGNYETVDLSYGMTVKPLISIENDETRKDFISCVEKDVEEMLAPQMLKVREWVKQRNVKNNS